MFRGLHSGSPVILNSVASYDQRSTGGESTVESAWTIAKLSVLLSSLTTPPSLRAALAASVRRSLVYPLYRHWALALACLRDVAVLLALGRRAVVRTLVETRRLLEQHDSYHCHNRLYLDHYIVVGLLLYGFPFCPFRGWQCPAS